MADYVSMGDGRGHPLRRLSLLFLIGQRQFIGGLSGGFGKGEAPTGQSPAVRPVAGSAGRHHAPARKRATGDTG